MRDIVERLQCRADIENHGAAISSDEPISDILDDAAAAISALRQQMEKARAQGRDEGLEEALDLLTAHELYRYRPKAFVGFIDHVRALKSGEGGK